MIRAEQIKKALQDVKKALAEGDAASIVSVLAMTPKRPTREETANAIAGLLSQVKEGEGEVEEQDGSPQACLYHLMHASLVRYEQIEERLGAPAFRLWLREPGGRSGQVVLLEQSGQLLWLFEALVSAAEGSWTGKPTGYSSPTNAFLSVAQAQSIRDLLTIHRSMARGVLRGLAFEKYREVVGEKRKKGVAFPYTGSGQVHLEEEVLPPEDGKQKCRVWRLDEKGKRTTFELFVKEGDEWKWLPDPKCIWYPAKTEDDPKE
jgi:hypothetical protein